MRKILAVLFVSLIFCSVVFAENGPKTIDQAVEKFFKNRKLDPIEGIWNANYGTYGEANYAIVKISKNKYKLWTITHTVSKYEGGDDPNAIWELNKDLERDGYGYMYNCSQTTYDPSNPSVEGIINGICELSIQNSAYRIWIAWNNTEELTSWTRVYPENTDKIMETIRKEVRFRENLRKIKKNANSILIGIGGLVFFFVFLQWSKKNDLTNYNKKNKTKFKTYSELSAHKKKLAEIESKKAEKKHALDEKKLELKRKAEETKLLKEEKRREKLEKTSDTNQENFNDENLMSKIKRLKSLYKNGTLTKAEFEKAKNKLLK